MKKNPKYIFSQDKNNNELNIQKDDSLEKYFNPIEDSHESEDILKKLENLNFSEETSFELPQKIFEPLTEKQIEQDNMYNKDDDIKNNNEDKKFTKFDLINDPQNKINEENSKFLICYILFFDFFIYSSFIFFSLSDPIFPLFFSFSSIFVLISYE